MLHAMWTTTTASAAAAAILACFELAPWPSLLQPRLGSLLEIIGYILATSLSLSLPVECVH